MSDKNFKTMRKQIRNVTQDLFKDTLTQEFSEELHAKIKLQVEDRLNRIEQHILGTLKQIDDRNKSVQAFVMNEVSKQMRNPNELPPAEAVAAPSTTLSIDEEHA